MPIKLSAREFRIIGAGLLIAAASVALGIKYFRRAFPEASIVFRVNRDDSKPLALRFLADRGASLAGYRHASIFDYDDQAKVYLERTEGLERLDALTNGPLHLWRWSNRWFRPQQIEEYRVDVSPSGQIVGYDHQIPEDAPGASLDEAAARALAEKFLGDAVHRALSDLDFVETKTEKRKARTDYTFTWKQRDMALGEASGRVQVGVDGDRVGGYREFLEIPEKWTRDYEDLRSRNDVAQTVAQVFWTLLSIAMVGILILRLRDRDAPILMAAAFGLVAAVLYFLGQLNDFSLAQFGYDTRDAYSSFLAGYFVRSVVWSLAVGVGIFILVGSSEPYYREHFPRLQSIRKAFTWQGVRTRSFFIANVVGITMTFFFFAYQTIFYLIANRLGAWAPADIQYSDLLNTRWPWVWVLFMGFVPAVSEETQFRAFAIPFLSRLTRTRWLGVVLAAFMWSFLHSAYPNQPFFIRGLEVGLGGILIGVVMMRFGIIATMIWHFSVDALYTAFLLLRSGNSYLMVSGAVTAGVMLVPLGVALVAYLRTGTFADEAALTNASAGLARRLAEERPAEAEAPLAYQPLPASRLWGAVLLTVVLAAVAFIPVYEFGKGIKLRTTRAGALRLSDDFFKARQIDPTKFRRAAWLEENADALSLRYLLERRSVEEADRIYRQASKILLWNARYFRPMEKEEYQVKIDADTGQVFSFQHQMDESMAGPEIGSDAAKALSETFLSQKGYDLSKFELQGLDATKPEKLQHYDVRWQAKPGDPLNVGDAKHRLEVEIAGGQVVGFNSYFKLPEEWTRERTARSLFNWVMIGLGIICGSVILAAMLAVFVKQVRAGAIRWRRSLILASVFFVVVLLSELNQTPTLDRLYQTSIPLGSFRVLIAVALFLFPLIGSVLVWLVVGLATSLYPAAWRIFQGPARRTWRRDALVSVALFLASAAAFGRLSTRVADHFHTFAPINVAILPGGLDGVFPGGSFFIACLELGFLYPAIIGIVIYIVRSGIKGRPWWLLPLALVFLVALGPTGSHSAAEFFLKWGASALSLLGGVAIVSIFFRDNILAYLAAAFCAPAVGPMVNLFSDPAPFYRWNGVALAMLVAAVLAWMFLPTTSRNPQFR